MFFCRHNAGNTQESAVAIPAGSRASLAIKGDIFPDVT